MCYSGKLFTDSGQETSKMLLSSQDFGGKEISGSFLRDFSSVTQRLTEHSRGSPLMIVQRMYSPFSLILALPYHT